MNENGAIGRGSPGLVAPMRALLCARHSRSLAAQLVAFDSGYCAPSASCTAPLAFLPASASDPAQHGLAPHTREVASVPMQRTHGRRIGGGLERNQCPFGCRGRRAGFGRDGREWRYVLGLLGADGAEDSLALGQLGLATGDARRILGCHLGVAYDAERGQQHENRSTAPAAKTR